jgi:hypothetical protein
MTRYWLLICIFAFLAPCGCNVSSLITAKGAAQTNMESSKLSLTHMGTLAWDTPEGVPQILETPASSSLLTFEQGKISPLRAELQLLPAADGRLAVCAKNGHVALIDAQGRWLGSLSLPATALARCWSGPDRITTLSLGATGMLRLEEWQLETGASVRATDLAADAAAWSWALEGDAEQVYLLSRRGSGWEVTQWETDGRLVPLPAPRPISVAPILVADGRLFAFSPQEAGQIGMQLKGGSWQTLSGKSYQPSTSLQRLLSLDSKGCIWTQGGALLTRFAADGRKSDELRIFNLVQAADGSIYLNTLVGGTGSAEAGYQKTGADGRLGGNARFNFPERVLQQRDLRNAYLVNAGASLWFETFDANRQSVLTEYDPASQEILQAVVAPDDYLLRVQKQQSLHTVAADAQGRLYLAVAQPAGLAIFLLTAH